MHQTLQVHAQSAYKTLDISNRKKINMQRTEEEYHISVKLFLEHRASSFSLV
jgi:hypothetical protein